ncbi:MAG: histidinol-phosphate transaminase [Bryobacterales bacterium]|nr:histidinol-phosphate transaminase [Bryobacterales bacterium]
MAGNQLAPRPAVERMAAYSPPSSGRAGKLRLDFNENTLGASPRVVAALERALKADALAVYPEYAETKPVLANFFGVQPDEFILTNGTDEAIQVLVNTYVDDGDDVIILHPSYAMYRFYSEVAGANIVEVSYRAGSLDFPMEELLAAITPRTKAILISNPNNPTGTAFRGFDQVLAAAPHAAVLIDEAYFEFCQITALPLIGTYPNLFVSRTFSKVFGMAAMRVGCLFSQAQNVAWMHKAQSPYSVNMPAAVAVRAAVEDTEYVAAYVRQVLAARERCYEGLARLAVKHWRSEGNFVLFVSPRPPKPLCTALREQGILVRDRSHDIPNTVRVTVGTMEQIERFLTALEGQLR